jgi:hypothetical protein
MGLRRWLRSWPIFERRWIPDGTQRDAHHDTVRRRLPGGARPPPADPPAAAAPDQSESTPGRPAR